MNIAFFIASGVAIYSTFMAITGKHPVHSLLYLILSLLAVAVVFFTLGAPFLAALEVIVYAGAIIVLFLFIVMMLNLGPGSENLERIRPSDWIGPGLLSAVLFGLLVSTFFQANPSFLGGEPVHPKEVGLELFTSYMLAVQLAAFLLLAGLVGATHLRKRDS